MTNRPDVGWNEKERDGANFPAAFPDNTFDLRSGGPKHGNGPHHKPEQTMDKRFLYVLAALASLAVIATAVKRYRATPAPEAPPAAVAAEPEEVLTPEERSLDGRYSLIGYRDRYGDKDEEESQRGEFETGIEINGRKFTLYENYAKPVQGVVKLNPQTSPKRIDVSCGPLEGHGIYVLNGDTLTLCTTNYSEKRPKDFQVTGEAFVATFRKVNRPLRPTPPKQ